MSKVVADAAREGECYLEYEEDAKKLVAQAKFDLSKLIGECVGKDKKRNWNNERFLDNISIEYGKGYNQRGEEIWQALKERMGI